MNQHMRMFGIALLILSLITAVILGLIAGPTSPLTWVLVAILVAIPFIHRKLSAKSFITWKDEYSVGLDSIDQQHKKLINLINQLTTAVDYSTGEEFEREALAELVEYTKTHFSYEEGLMEDNGYPDFEAHRAQHRAMIAEVEAVLSEPCFQQFEFSLSVRARLDRGSGLFRPRQRQVKVEDRTLAGRALDTDAASHHLDQLPTDRQAQARAHKLAR